ncbi:MAG: ribosome small subunit-dependent GTPase A [Saprospiraceae bacterium]|nr:ribosome small subunit-dependent GTPase A [Saprospiraceae bacterium]
MKGKVVKSTGSWYEVKTEEGKKYQCRVVGKMRLEGLKLTNPIGVGDIVDFDLEDTEEKGIIRSVEPRTNYVLRQSPRKKHHLHLLASNIDQAMLVVTIAEPMLKPGFIDRFLVMTEPYDIPVIIVFNKADILGEGGMDLFNDLKKIYTNIGYEVLLVSSMEGTGIDEVKKALKDKTTLIGGQSGVGKSTLINALQPGLELKTTELSDYSGKGQHTTTFAEMFELDFGAEIIDTPGLKTLSFNHLEAMDVAHNFREIFKYSKECRFSNCTHMNEPGCAVKEAVEKGEIHPWRYDNYVQIVEEIEDQNYWERHKDY